MWSTRDSLAWCILCPRALQCFACETAQVISQKSIYIYLLDVAKAWHCDIPHFLRDIVMLTWPVTNKQTGFREFACAVSHAKHCKTNLLISPKDQQQKHGIQMDQCNSSQPMHQPMHKAFTRPFGSTSTTVIVLYLPTSLFCCQGVCQNVICN